jgi:hypothetical protein
LAHDLDRYYQEEWYDQTLRATVIRAARAVADAPHDQAPVAHLTTAIANFQWYPSRVKTIRASSPIGTNFSKRS